MSSIKVEVLDRINTFLLLSMNKKAGEEFNRDQKIEKIEKCIYEGFREWKRIYKNRLAKVYGWDPYDDKERINELCRRKLLFQFPDTNKEEDYRKHCNFSLPLLGRHDFVCLLEGPYLVEMSSMLYNINRKLEEDELITDSLNMSVAPMDFCVDDEHFLGREKWFVEDGKSPKQIEIFKDRVYAIVCVEFKKGMKENGRFVRLPDLLGKLKNLTRNSKDCIKGMFLGLGLHELILIFGSKKVSDIIASVTDLRLAYSSKGAPCAVRDTSTIFCIPRKPCEDCQEDYEIEYSTLLSVVVGKGIKVFGTIKGLEKDREIRTWLKDGIEVFERQGYYDLIVSFKPRSHFDAARFTTKLYEVDGVLKTSTLIKMKEDDLERKLESWGVTKR